LFGTLHPLRDILDEQALHLAVVGSALQAVQGVALIALSRIGANWPSILIATGTTGYSAMLYFMIFTDQHPLDEVVPLSGVIMLLGWLLLALTPPKHA
jgi:uncharacterized membrane protein YgdD (TMEM256/DUF423 family)